MSRSTISPAAREGSLPRVVLVSGPAVGGIRTHLEKLCDLLGQWGCRHLVACPASLKLPVETLRVSMELGDRPRPSDLTAIHRLREVLVDDQPTLVHAHGWKSVLITSLAMAGVRPLQSVATLHNLWKSGLPRPLCSAAIQRFDRVLGVSNAVLQSHRVAGIRLPTSEVLPPTVDLERFRPADRLIRSPYSPIRVLFAGRWTEEKGAATLLGAMSLVPAGLVEWWVAEVGEPEPGLAPPPSGPEVLRLGPVSRIEETYRQVDLVVVPSLSEGLGLVAAEAMASGKAVIASSVGGLPELITHGVTGCLVPPGEPSALAAAVEQLARCPASCRQLGSAAREEAERRFAPAAWEETMRRAYLGL